jgi:hypothetical protein
MDDTERSRRADDRALDDRALDDPVYAELFDAMKAEASGPAPAMGPELSAMVSGAQVPSLTARRTRVRTAVVGLAVLGAVAGGAGAAAAAGVSPSHAARFATSIIQRMPGVDPSGDSMREEDTRGGTEHVESPSPTTTGGGDELNGADDSPGQVSPHRPSRAGDDQSATSRAVPDEDEHTSAGEPSSTGASDDGDGPQTRSTDTDERTAPSTTTSTDDDADSESSRETDDGSGTSQEQSDG